MSVPAGLDPQVRLRIIERAANGETLPHISRAMDLHLGLVRSVAVDAGYPSRDACRSAGARLVLQMRVPIPRPRPAPAPQTRPEVRRAALIHAAVRARDRDQVGRLTEDLSRQDLVEVIVALAAMLPARISPARALAWVDGDRS